MRENKALTNLTQHTTFTDKITDQKGQAYKLE